MTDACELCASPKLGPDGRVSTFNRVAGLELCDVCLSGHLVSRMNQRFGWQLECNQYEDSNTEYGVETSNAYVSEVTLRFNHGLPLRIKCRRRRWFHLLFDLFGKTAKVNDPLFDRNVVVRGGPPAMVRMLLESDGVQGAVMSFALNGWFDIDEQGIDARRVSHDAPHTEGEVMAEVCAVALRMRSLLPGS